MAFNYDDIYLKTEIDGYLINNIFQNKQLFITNLDKITDNYNIGNYERYDVIANKLYSDDKLFWVILILNKNKIKNPLTLNFKYTQYYKSFIKLLTYNPVKYIKKEVFLYLQEYLYMLYKIKNDISLGNIICDGFYSDNIDNMYENIKLLLELTNKLNYKYEIEVDEEDIPIDDFKDNVLDLLNKYNLNYITQSINLINLDISDDTKYTKNITIDYYNYEYIKRIKYFFDFLFFWANNRVE